MIDGVLNVDGGASEIAGAAAPLDIRPTSVHSQIVITSISTPTEKFNSVKTTIPISTLTVSTPSISLPIQVQNLRISEAPGSPILQNQFSNTFSTTQTTTPFCYTGSLSTTSFFNTISTTTTPFLNRVSDAERYTFKICRIRAQTHFSVRSDGIHLLILSIMKTLTNISGG